MLAARRCDAFHVAKQQAWHSSYWSTLFRAALRRRGWESRDYARLAKISTAQVSRLANGRASLEITVQACKLLGLPPPLGQFCKLQDRLLSALAELRVYLERRWGFEADEDGARALLDGDPAATKLQLESLVATVEGEVRKLVGDSPAHGVVEHAAPLGHAR